MLNNLPHNILEYLVNELPPFTGVLIIKTSEKGIILDLHGPHNEYLVTKPVIGKPVHDYVPALFSMIPPLVSPEIINMLQSHNGVYVDIHIVEDDQNKFWVFFVDQNREAECIKDIMQKINEDKLFAESETTEIKGDSINPFSVFDYLNLKIEDNENAIIGSNIPKWFKLLYPEFSENDTVNITEVFPYFEVFLVEAEEFWVKKVNGKMKSGIWVETLEDGHDLALNAYAVYYNDLKNVFIQPVEEVDKEQVGYQLAREQKLAYEKLEKAEKKLKSLLEYKDKFVSIVSHDLRSPVAAVLGIADMLVNDKKELSKLDEFYIEMIHSIKDEMLRLLDYNDKLYHWSNLELGNFQIVKEKVSLNKIISTALRTAEKKLLSKHISVSTNIKKDIEVDVDSTLFLQVLNNLLANAIKFTPDNGSVSINVTKGKNLQISVNDSGVGMSKRVSDSLLSGFTSNSSMGTDGEKGTGLGLSIVIKILDAHGFTLKINSEEGVGSEFIITIPK